jgi:uncharacterized protein involved in exopolysaccharide biosynthesis
MAAATIAAVMILLKAPARAATPATPNKGPTIMLGVIIGLLLAGLLLYWVL